MITTIIVSSMSILLLIAILKLRKACKDIDALYEELEQLDK